MNTIFKFLNKELHQATRASEVNCQRVAQRLATEVGRICAESARIQASGDVESWAMTLARHRLEQCLKYYRLGSHRGRIELHSTLSAIIYRYVNFGWDRSSHQARLTLIEDFLQGFYIESLNVLRREGDLGATYQPRTLLELAEYMAFVERYGKRRITLPRRGIQQLIVLRVQTFCQQQPQETMVDMEEAAEGRLLAEMADPRLSHAFHQVREQMVDQGSEPTQAALRQKVLTELFGYLKQRKQQACADYLTLRLQDLSTSEIEAILGLTPRQRDYLQQRFKYHLLRFALSHHWQLVHEWLGVDLERNLGLLPQQWQEFQNRLDSQQRELLQMKRLRYNDKAICQALGCTLAQTQRQWAKLLEQAWEVRNLPPAKLQTVLEKQLENQVVQESQMVQENQVAQENQVV